MRTAFDASVAAKRAKGAPRAETSTIGSETWLRTQKTLLRFNTCGDVGSGKSTLVGRLLGEHGVPPHDLDTPEADSSHAGMLLEELVGVLPRDDESSVRVQGGEDENDVAYHLFSTEGRSFIVADGSGHERCTADVVVGASTADLSIVVVDARKGVTAQTRRHSFLISLLGIRRLVLAVNKMDLVGYSQETFASIAGEYRTLAERLGVQAVTCIPVSAVAGDNVVHASRAMPWYRGPTLLGFLDGLEVDETRVREQPLRLPVQWVNRRIHGFHGYAGTIAAGIVRVGDAVRVQPSARVSRVARIVTYDGDLEQAFAGQSVTIVLADEIEVSRGDLITPANEPAEVADQFEATVVWMHEAPLLPGRSYFLKIGAKFVTATIAPLKRKIDASTMEWLAASTLDRNEVGVCNLELDRPIAFDPYEVNHDTGGFILIDRLSHETVGAGMLHFALRRAHNVHWQAIDVTKTVRSAAKGQKPCLLWFTGLSGAGKSTIANLVDKKLHVMGRHTYLLDGDNVRHGLNKDLGFTDADRVENIRRVAEVAKLMVDAGLIVGSAFISPFRAERQMARALLREGEFFEIFVDTPLGIAEQRDPKGLYRKARRGDLKNFTGVDSPYEAPESPELRIDTTQVSPEGAADMIVAFLRDRNMLVSG